MVSVLGATRRSLAAFEMYGLTMRGQQMLFSMIAHVMPPLGFGYRLTGAFSVLI